MTDRDLRRLLKWAAGCPDDVSDIADVDEDRLLRHLGEHRLACRLLRRLRRDRPAWGRRSLLTETWGRCQHATAQMRRHAAALQEITRACADTGHAPLIVKGFSLYALTGDPDDVRDSADMDLFHPDPARLKDVLLALGYADVEGVVVAPHEHAVMARAGVLVEIHDYLPVQTYFPHVTPDAYLPEDHPGLWRQPAYHWPDCTSLTDPDLRQDVTRGPAPEADGLTLPGPTTMALVLCAHAFRNVIEGRRPKVAEIADLPILTRHPQFDARRFVEWVERYGAQDAAHVTAHLERCYLGSRSLPAVSAEADWDAGARLPQYPGYWIGWQSAEDSLLPPEPGGIFARLGANKVMPGGTYSVAEAGPGEPIPRLIVLAAQDEVTPFQFSYAWAQEALDFELVLPRPLPNAEQAYHVRFDDENSVVLFFANVRGGRVEAVGAGSAALSPPDPGYILRISLPGRALPRPIADGMIPLILSVALDHFEELGVRTDPIVRVPLLITGQQVIPDV